MMIQLTDNQDITQYAEHPIIKELLNRDLDDLSKDNFIIFPGEISGSEDLSGDNFIFSQHNRSFRTGNIVGRLKKGDEEVRINSRFYQNIGNGEDFFLKYLLEKVMNINVVRTTLNTDSESDTYDILAYLFPMYLDRAMRKGVYKEYVKRHYNDANIKGPINIARHVKTNLPFMGKVAYDTREFSYDNKVTQLIRHAIEKIDMDYDFDFRSDNDFKSNVRAIIDATPSYSRMERYDIVEENMANPVRHGYYEEYYMLQKLAIQILNEDRIGFGEDDEEVHGIIIDVAWLWEEYLDTLLGDTYIHPRNKATRKKRGISVYSDRTSTVYPDFYRKDHEVVIDAKYKRLDESEKTLKREDRYQIISYLHILSASKAGIVYPSKHSSNYIHVGKLSGLGGDLFKQPLLIPQQKENYTEFISSMKMSETVFMTQVDSSIIKSN
jgi:5-methylcytosine-specific restriction endonuclease McrBC regulatory subunit McrC